MPELRYNWYKKYNKRRLAQLFPPRAPGRESLLSLSLGVHCPRKNSTPVTSKPAEYK